MEWDEWYGMCRPQRVVSSQGLGEGWSGLSGGWLTIEGRIVRSLVSRVQQGFIHLFKHLASIS